MQYTIGEFAHLLGVTTDTLRVYEKQGIILPRKDKQNNYRYYNDIDCRNILMSRWYRSLDIPLKEAAGLIRESCLDEVRGLILEKKEALKTEIDRLMRMEQRLTSLSCDLEGLEDRLNSPFRCRSQGFYRIRQTSGNELLNDQKLKCRIGRWMELLPFSFFSVQVKREDFRSSRIPFNWGLAMEEEDFIAFSMDKGSCVEYIPPSDCIRCVVRTEGSEDFSPGHLQKILNFMESRNLSPAGDLFGRMLLNEREENGIFRSYLELSCPV